MNKASSRERSGTDWQRLSTMKDSEIDVSESPELDDAFFANATLLLPEPKKPISLRLDKDVIDWYRKQGAGYQTRMNAVLRMYMKARGGRTRKPSAPRSSRVSASRQTTRR